MAIVDVFTLAEQDTALHRASRGRYQGPCPGCGGTDRFYVTFIHRSGEQRWGCNNCKPGYHDAIAYLRHFKAMSFPAAKAQVNGDQATTSQQTKARIDQALQDVSMRGKAPGQDWQDKTHASILSAAAALYSEPGLAALQYLYSRGLTDETIKKSKLGYAVRIHPSTEQKVQCIVIPWYENGVLWRVQFRDMAATKENRYFLLGGSSNASMYLADSLQLARDTTVIVEGEIDALTIAQECSELANVVATGSTTHSRNVKNVVRLTRCKSVLVSFDNEKKGEENAQFWLARLDNARRYRPLIHDVNSMHTAGLSVRDWLAAALQNETDQDVTNNSSFLPAGRIDIPEQQTSEIAAPDQDMTIDNDVTSELLQGDEISAVCSVCSADVEYYSPSGQAYCSLHYPAEQHVYTPDEHIDFMRLAWPGQFKIELVSGLPVHRLATSEPPTPIMLLPVQRLATCAHYEQRLIRDKNNSFLVRPDGLCKNTPSHGLFCELHKHNALLMELGEKVGYPALQLNQYIGIEAGYSAWLEHARWRIESQLTGRSNVNPDIERDLPAVKRMVDKALLAVS